MMKTKAETKRKYRACPECEACFLLADGEVFPTHRFLGKLCTPEVK